MKLTARDKRLLHTLGDFGVLSTAQVQALFFAEIAKTTMMRRLRRLESMALLRRPGRLDDGSFGWCLTKKAAALLGMETSPGHFNRNTLWHEVLLNQVRLSLARIGIGENWTSERTLRRRNWRYSKYREADPEVIPDGLFSVRANGNYHAVAVELELSAKGRERYRKVLRTYRLKSNIGLLWYLVRSPAMAKIIVDEWQKMDWRGDYLRLGWSLVHEVLANPSKATIHLMDKRIHLSELFQARQMPNETAHSPAQGVSNAAGSSEAKSEAANLREDSENLPDLAVGDIALRR